MKNAKLQCALFIACVLGWSPVFGLAGEPAREFIDALRQRHYYDLTLDYLDRLAASPLAPPDIKQTLDYERGVTMVMGANRVSDYELREKQLDLAQAALKKFTKEHAKHALIPSARSQLGNVLLVRAKLKVEQANEGERETRLKEARKLFGDARKVFEASKEDIAERLKAFPKVLDMTDKKQAAMADERNQLRSDYLQVLILGATAIEESADTYAVGAKEHTAILKEAAAAHNAVYEKYRRRMAGLYSRMYQGRCYQKMRDFKEALSYYVELLDNPDSPDAFRDLKTKVYLLAMDCWLDKSQNLYAKAIEEGSAWISKARPNEMRDPEWLTLRLALARAYIAHAESLKEGDPQKRRSLKEASILARYVIRFPGQTQKPAQSLLGQLGRVSTASGEEPNPKNFAEAIRVGKEALDEMQISQQMLAVAQAKFQAEKDPAKKANLQKQVGEATTAFHKNQSSSRKFYELALRLVDAETSVEDVNIARYFLSYLYFLQQKYYESAVMGEFVARRYPDSTGAKPSAKISLASYLQLYQAAGKEDRAFETRQLLNTARYIAGKWAGTTEGAQALSTLVPFVLNQGDYNQAIEYMRQIPETSPLRADAELKVGKSLWGSYLVGTRELNKRLDGQTPDAAAQAEQKALNERITLAEETLAAGMARLKKSGAVTRDVVTAALSLAQLYVDTNRPLEALKELEDPRTGALLLLRKKAASTQSSGIPEEILKTALRAYIGSLAVADNPDDAMSKAKGVMAELKTQVGDTAAGKKRLVSVYVSLARKIESSLESAPEDVKKSLSKGFDTFLQQVRSEANDSTVLSWIGETFLGLGKGFDTNPNRLTPEASSYYNEALKTFDLILAKGQKDPSWLPAADKPRVQLKAAEIKRRKRDYQGALDDFAAILRVQNTLLNVQIQAAYTYQEWGREDPKHYLDALVGGYGGKGKKNVIWGWRRLATTASRYPKYQNQFHESRYNSSVARLAYAKTTKKKDDFERAKKYITLTNKLFPDMGGDVWRAKYDALLRKIQTELGEKPVGLGAKRKKQTKKSA